MDKFEKCKSCKHYKEHYILSGTVFRPIEGHCINRALYNPRKRHNFELIENCEHWEINTEVKAKQKEDVKNALNYIKEHLANIEQILRLEENENAPK